MSAKQRRSTSSFDRAAMSSSVAGPLTPDMALQREAQPSATAQLGTDTPWLDGLETSDHGASLGSGIGADAAVGAGVDADCPSFWEGFDPLDVATGMNGLNVNPAELLDTVVKNTHLPDWKGLGSDISTISGYLSSVTSGSLPGPAGGVLRSLSGAGRMNAAVNDDNPKRSMLSRASGLGRGLADFVGGATQAASPFIQSAEATAACTPVIGGILGAVKSVDSLSNIANEGGMSFMNGLDAAQGALTTIGAFGGQASGMAAIGGTSVAELGALGLTTGGASAAAGILGAGVAGFKLGDLIAEHTGIDEAIGDGVADLSTGALEAVDASPTALVDMLNVGEQLFSGKGLTDAVDGTYGTGTLADKFGWLPGT